MRGPLCIPAVALASQLTFPLYLLSHLATALTSWCLDPFASFVSMKLSSLASLGSPTAYIELISVPKLVKLQHLAPTHHRSAQCLLTTYRTAQLL